MYASHSLCVVFWLSDSLSQSLGLSRGSQETDTAGELVRKLIHLSTYIAYSQLGKLAVKPVVFDTRLYTTLSTPVAIYNYSVPKTVALTAKF